MIDRTLARGLFLAAVSLAFGLGALRYPLGDFANAGAGLFPLMVSCLLFVIAVITVIRSRFVEGEALHFNVKNIALIMTALIGFALVSKFVNMIAGIVFMVFVASYAGTSPSWKRSLQISAGLVLVAFGFQKLLGLNLPLY
jgi:hypothetical protein